MGKNKPPFSKKSRKSNSFPHQNFKHNKRVVNFIHPLSPKYNIAAKALKSVLKLHEPIETLAIIQGEKLNKEAGLLTRLTLEHIEEIDYLLEKMNLINKDEMNLWQLRILIAEMLWGTQILYSAAKMVIIARKYEIDFRESFVEISTVIKNPANKTKDLFPTYIRVNTLSMSIESCINAFTKEGWNLLPRCQTYLEHLRVVKNLEGKNFIKDFHIFELFIFPSGTSFYEHPGYLKGKFLIQDKGSCLSSFLLNPKPGSIVFDMCAAVGVKTNHLANIINNEGVIYANDIHEERLKKMNFLMDLTNVKCAKLSKSSFAQCYEPKDIKYILIDPNSTYSGLFLHAEKSSQTKKITKYKRKQSLMLKYALQMFPNVKRIVYTVCSIYPEEGIDIINQISKNMGKAYNLLDVKEMLWNEWQSVSYSKSACGDKCLQVKPEFDLCQGYFIAVFERNFDKPLPVFDEVCRLIAKKSINNTRKDKSHQDFTEDYDSEDSDLEELEFDEEFEPKKDTKPFINIKPMKEIKPVAKIRPVREFKSDETTRKETAPMLQVELMKNSNFDRSKENSNYKSYDRSQQQFMHSYETLNPMTHNLASTSAYYDHQQIYETTHDQLYP